MTMIAARQCRYCPIAWTVEYDDHDNVLHNSDTHCPRCDSDDAVPFCRPEHAHELPGWSEFSDERARAQLSRRDDAKARWARDYLRDG